MCIHVSTTHIHKSIITSNVWKPGCHKPTMWGSHDPTSQHVATRPASTGWSIRNGPALSFPDLLAWNRPLEALASPFPEIPEVRYYNFLPWNSQAGFRFKMVQTCWNLFNSLQCSSWVLSAQSCLSQSLHLKPNFYERKPRHSPMEQPELRVCFLEFPAGCI